MDPNKEEKVILSTFFVEFKDVQINNDTLYYLLSVGNVDSLETKKKGDQIKIKHPGASDIIYSISHKNKTRGLRTNLRETYLKNGVCVHITSRERLIHIKILNSSLGISGADSEETVEEVATYISNRIEQINYILNRIQTSPLAPATLQWVEDNTKGTLVTVLKGTSYVVSPYEEIIFQDGVRYVVCKDYDDHITKPEDRIPHPDASSIHKLIRVEEMCDVVVPSEYNTFEYPEDIDADIADFLIDKIFECRLHSHFCMLIKGISQIKSTYNGDLSQYTIKTSMIVHNMYINIKEINLGAFYMLPRSVLGEFILIQNDDNTSSIKLQLRYTITPELVPKIKIKRSKVHTLQIYRMGRVTLSGPHIELNKIATSKFLQLINNIMPKIRG